MDGETNLKTLLSTMQPDLHSQPFVFCTLQKVSYDNLNFTPLCTFFEREGISVIATQDQAQDNRLDYDMTWACITLTVHSSLSAVGFLAAIITRLAKAGISVNPVSAYYHDHLFVPWENRDAAMDVLHALMSSN